MSKKHRVHLEILKPDLDCDFFHGRSVLYDRPHGGGDEFELNVINIELGHDGSVRFFSDDVENFIYFYPEQIKHLTKALSVRAKKRRHGGGKA